MQGSYFRNVIRLFHDVYHDVCIPDIFHLQNGKLVLVDVCLSDVDSREVSLPGTNQSSSGVCDGPSTAAGDLAPVVGAFGMEKTQLVSAAAPGKFCVPQTSPC